ncbi:putative acyl-CoA dehydrogenase [Gordonia araii NBRC 100433]|uniref:Putative acyl-CoA dehydrogenase n=1 Tax=Gordonia araii NBRC 100433 TaxID=1073574 RepID=G7H344_9ACTN|nr:acyl-CoA dehydrogenase family protein [Gordonia araii]NNG96388.1 acyl-CoA dehydrogenase [Gordonia araii NBRC 100433]GAB10269.1 putative acyl-CoA dehydrogenase [Gordonia araii NBRC 100433]
MSDEAISAEDLAALRDSVRDLLARSGGSEAVRAAIASDRRVDGGLWQRLAGDIGVAALAVPEDLGGVGAGWGALAAVVEEVGATLAPVPLFSSAVLATGALLVAARHNGDGAAGLVESLAGGERTATLVVADESSWETPGVKADGGLLTGTAHYVTDAEAATDLVVLAGQSSTSHVTLHVVAADAPGVTIIPVATMDPTRPLSQVAFEEVSAQAVPAPDDLLPRIRDLAWALLAVEQVGAAGAALRMTVEYAKERKQFGRAIGSFQALKHRMADMYADVETARSIAYAAVDAVGTSEGAEFAAAAHVYCSEAFNRVVAEAIQLHGGIGITWEHDIQLYFKRAHSAAQFFGQPADVVAAAAL